MLYLDTKHELDKLQKLQNRALRQCLNVLNPCDMSVDRFHDLVFVDKLNVRRDMQLLNIM